ncbi:MAG: hypothetical protein BJ554DRAFT_2675, partial [Olpidium bornovanus]
MEPIVGFPNDRPDTALEMICALYGFHQSAFEWHDAVDRDLREHGWLLLPVERYLLALPYGSAIDLSKLRKIADAMLRVDEVVDAVLKPSEVLELDAVLGLFVDDVVWGAKTDADRIGEELRSNFHMDPAREATHVIGIRIITNPSCSERILIQDHIVSKILERFGMANSHAVKTPIDSFENLEKRVDTATAKEILRYQQVIGSLL